MKKRNSKGFTLIEVLGILIILALLILLISKPVMNMINNSRNEISASQEKSILNAAEKWSVDNSDKFDDIEGKAIQIGLDIVFVLDVSGSMTSQAGSTNRYRAMVDATNSAFEVLEGDLNRQSIVTYSSSPTVFLPLANYTSDNNKYLESGSSLISTSSTLKQNGSIISKKSIRITGTTYTQAGIRDGSGILIGSDLSEKTQRIPVLILLTDGDPTSYTTNENHSGNCTYCSGSGHATAGYYTILAANYFKPKIESHYKIKNMFFYTVGLGIKENTFAELVLNPTEEKISKGLTSSGNRKTLANTLKNNGNIKNYSYADKAYINTINAEDLKNAFSEIANEVIEATKVTQVCVTVKDLYDSGYLSTKDINLASDKAASQYILMSYNEAINQYGYSLAKTDEQINACKKLLEENTTP